MKLIYLSLIMSFTAAEASAQCKDCVKLPVGAPGDELALVAMNKEVSAVSRAVASELDSEVVDGLCDGARELPRADDFDAKLLRFEAELQLVAEEKGKKVSEVWEELYAKVTCKSVSTSYPSNASLLGVIAWKGFEQIESVVGKYSLDLNLKHQTRGSDIPETIMEWINRTLTTKTEITENTKMNLIKIGKIFNLNDAKPDLVKCKEDVEPIVCKTSDL